MRSTSSNSASGDLRIDLDGEANLYCAAASSCVAASHPPLGPCPVRRARRQFRLCSRTWGRRFLSRPGIAVCARSRSGAVAERRSRSTVFASGVRVGPRRPPPAAPLPYRRCEHTWSVDDDRNAISQSQADISVLVLVEVTCMGEVVEYRFADSCLSDLHQDLRIPQPRQMQVGCQILRELLRPDMICILPWVGVKRTRVRRAC